MPPPQHSFLEGVKAACTGDPATPLVLIGNFEVEDEWARDEIGLPTAGGRSAAAVVNRMDEFALLLAGEHDHVVLKSQPDPDYLDWLDGLGIGLPRILVVDRNNPDNTVSADAVESPALQARLAELAASGHQLLPHGMSELEERLCAATGLPSALPPVGLVKAVNSKVYSRRLARELGIPLATGWECETVEEFRAAAEAAKASVAAGRKVGVKDAYGVSGKGIAVIDREQRLDQLVRMVTRRAERTGDQRIAVVVEEWADKAADLNYHFTVGRDGGVRFDFVKEAITAGGVHKGHRIPARITPAQHEAIVETAHVLGRHLASVNFHGLVGVDAITTTDGGLLPVLEINARNNMSTYGVPLQERFMGPDTVALARQYDVSLTAPIGFAELRAALGELLYTPGGSGLLVNNFATVNAAAGDGPFSGRLYGLLMAADDAELTAIDTAIATAVAGLRKEVPAYV